MRNAVDYSNACKIGAWIMAKQLENPGSQDTPEKAVLMMKEFTKLMSIACGVSANQLAIDITQHYKLTYGGLREIYSAEG